MRISAWSSAVCSPVLLDGHRVLDPIAVAARADAAADHHRRALGLEQATQVDEQRDRLAIRLGHVAFAVAEPGAPVGGRSEEHTSELQSLMRISYAVFCLKKKKKKEETQPPITHVKNITKEINNNYV